MEEDHDKPRKHIIKQRHNFSDKGSYRQSYVSFSSHVWMWELGHDEGCVLKNWCLQTVVLEKTFESLLDSKVVKPVNPKGNQSWIFIGGTDAAAEASAVWPPDVKSRHIRKDPIAGEDWGEKEKGAIEDKIIGWRHWLNGYEFEQTQGDSKGQGNLVCCRSWRGRELGHDLVTEHHNNLSMNLSKIWEMVRDRGYWSIAVHRVSESQTKLSVWTATMKPLLSEATHSYTLKILKAQFS